MLKCVGGPVVAAAACPAVGLLPPSVSGSNAGANAGANAGKVAGVLGGDGLRTLSDGGVGGDGEVGSKLLGTPGGGRSTDGGAAINGRRRPQSEQSVP